MTKQAELIVPPHRSGAWESFREVAQWINAEMSKAILGQSLTTKPKS